jgi:hypothetical protein
MVAFTKNRAEMEAAIPLLGILGSLGVKRKKMTSEKFKLEEQK